MPKPISRTEVLCLKVATAFSRMEKPDLKDADRHELDGLAVTLFNPDGVARMNEAVQELSEGKVFLRGKTRADAFKLEVMGPAAYLVLVGPDKRQRIIFTRGADHFIFEK